jgi:hypothetical protein
MLQVTLNQLISLELHAPSLLYLLLEKLYVVLCSYRHVIRSIYELIFPVTLKLAQELLLLLSRRSIGFVE